MSETEAPSTGVLASLRRMARSALELAQNRLELFALELQGEKLRLIETLLWLGVGLALGLIGLTLAAGILALFLWQMAGYYGLIGLALLFLAAGAIVLLRLRAELHKAPPPFADTIAEFKKDQECLREKS